MDNKINTWRQGKFIDSRRYDHMSERWKQDQRERESVLVRPGPTDNAICIATTPELAEWIAERLNVAADLEAKLRQNGFDLPSVKGPVK